MKNLDKYKGIIPAFYACYDDEGNISGERIERYAKHLLEAGVKGLYVGGSSGECIYQNVEERKAVLEHVMAAVGGKMTIIAHIAAPSTRDSVELARHAESLGVDALAAIPPIYFTLPEPSIEAYWTAMVEATSCDFFIYNIPQTTGYTLSVDLYNRMLAHPQVVGVKNSAMPVQDFYIYRAGAIKESIIFNGSDEQFIAGLMMGADGGIGGTYGVMPELFLAAEDAFKKGDNAKAQAIQFAINDIIFAMLACDGNLYAVEKAILAKNGLNIGDVRQPLASLSNEDLEAVQTIDQMIKDAKATYC